jgi:hypothetical protein
LQLSKPQLVEPLHLLCGQLVRALLSSYHVLQLEQLDLLVDLVDLLLVLAVHWLVAALLGRLPLGRETLDLSSLESQKVQRLLLLESQNVVIVSISRCHVVRHIYVG